MPIRSRGIPWITLCLFACGQSQSLTGAGNEDDYSLQGEYAGVDSATQTAMGAQVMALGQGTFRMLLLTGGLPGAGWDGQTYQIVPGAWQNGSVLFQQNGDSLTVDSSGTTLAGRAASGSLLRLQKVHRQSPDLGKPPPAGALVLFDGSSVSAWTHAVLDGNGDLLPTGVTESDGAISVQSFRNFTLHLEFRLPFEPTQTGQNRSNSGVVLQNRYEVQILDSFGQCLPDLAKTDTLEPKRHCGAFWEQWAPTVNMCFPPRVWQTYDIAFQAARFDSTGTIKLDSAHVTVVQNGVTIHGNRTLLNSTLLGDPEGPAPGPIRLQYHTDSVAFRNIWIVDSSTSPVLPRPAARKAVYLVPTRNHFHYLLDAPDLPFLVSPDGRRWPSVSTSSL